VRRRDTLGLAGALAGTTALASLDAFAETAKVETAADGLKVLRIVFPVAETGFDPPKVQDLYSRTVTAHIFETFLTFDHLARPVKLRPNLAVAMPEHSDDFKVWTVKLRPGIHFAPDEVFKDKDGKPYLRELVAQDFIYTYQRFADPATRALSWSAVEEQGIVGLAASRAKAEKTKVYDYNAAIEGLKALDRYTLQFTLEQGNPRFPENMSDGGWLGAVAREVVEHYGDKITEHPVGTGPYRLARWRRSSQIVLERNPNFRDQPWEADPTPDDAEGQAIAQRFRGLKVPIVDRVEVQIIEEAQPRYLSFVNRHIDLLLVPQEFVPTATPGGVLAPHLKKKNIQSWRVLIPYVQLAFFNMQHPLVGGLEPHKVALRRAFWLSLNVERVVRLGFRGQAVQAESILLPGTTGYDPNFHSENSEYSPAKAKALLDLYGYLDKDGDGWRETPDGQPLVVECATQPDGLSRQLDELMKKDLDAVGIKVVFKTAKWPENLKAARNGKLMLWRVGSSASVTDGQEVLQRAYGPSAGQANLASFKLPAFDAIYDQTLNMPDGPERNALLQKAAKLLIAYGPYKVYLFQYADLLAQPWLHGYRRPLFWNQFWHMVDVDMSQRPPTA
jgi:ABC-type transport system substrate-binding protein